MTAFPGAIWLDDDRAEREIGQRADITAEEAANLRKFANEGYFTIDTGLSAEDARRISDDVERLWRERPPNVSFAYDSPPMRFSDADASRHRKPRYRIHDLHSASPVALDLYLHPVLQRYASLILGEQAIATQSLFFEFGSQQALHRDSTVVPTPDFGQLVAAWIALEDIAPESGPLMYVPRSHHWPFYEFSPGRYLYDPTRDTGDDVAAAMNFYTQQLENSRIEPHQFLARRGEVLVWHSALMHGGAPPQNEMHTRRSLVVHYSSRRTQSTRDCAVVEDRGDGKTQTVFVTNEVLERGNACGFANPLNGTLAYRR